VYLICFYIINKRAPLLLLQSNDSIFDYERGAPQTLQRLTVTTPCRVAYSMSHVSQSYISPARPRLSRGHCKDSLYVYDDVLSINKLLNKSSRGYKQRLENI